MRINFPTVANETVASFRYRIKAPVDYLNAAGYTVTINDPGGADVAVFSKHFNTMKDAQGIKWHGYKKTVFDVCDNHFEGDNKAHYEYMCQQADQVVASTPMMAEVIKKYTGRDSVVIPDPYEWPEKEPKKYDRIERLFWYGHPVNMQALLRVMPEIDGYWLYAVGQMVDWFDFKVYPYSHGNMANGFENTDLVIIPTISDSRSKVKGPNRMVEAIRQGVFVVAEPLPCYEEFSKWMWVGGIRDGLNWAQKHRGELAGRVKEAQEYIKTKYSPEAIGEQWVQMIQELTRSNLTSAVGEDS